MADRLAGAEVDALHRSEASWSRPRPARRFLLSWSRPLSNLAPRAPRSAQSTWRGSEDQRSSLSRRSSSPSRSPRPRRVDARPVPVGPLSRPASRRRRPGGRPGADRAVGTGPRGARDRGSVDAAARAWGTPCAAFGPGGWRLYLKMARGPRRPLLGFGGPARPVDQQRHRRGVVARPFHEVSSAGRPNHQPRHVLRRRRPGGRRADPWSGTGTDSTASSSATLCADRRLPALPR